MTSKANDLAYNALGFMGNLRDFIYSVYVNGGTYTKNGTSSDRDAYDLQQRRIFFYDGRDSYRISSLLMKFLDDVTHREKLYESLGDAAGPMALRIHNLQAEYLDAAEAKDIGNADNIADQFAGACADLSETFASGIGKLFIQTEGNFGVAKTLHAKIAQNRHYYEQAKRFSDALLSLDNMGIEKTFECGHRNIDVSALESRYRVLISDRRAEWHAELSRLLKFFESYLFRLRNIAPDVKRFRDFTSHLNQNPGYEPPSLDDIARPPACLMIPPRFEVITHCDVNDPAAGDHLFELAKKIPAPKAVITHEQVSGTIERRGGRTKPTPPTPEHTAAIESFALTAKQSRTPLSALEWKRANRPELELSDDVWLLYIYSLRYSRHPMHIDTSFKKVSLPPTSPLSRNVTITDVIAYGR